MAEPKGIPITDPVELAWCEFARARAEMGFAVELVEQGVSIASFKAGVKWQAARIRRELGAWLDGFGGSVSQDDLR